jgi:hypothetical protein
MDTINPGGIATWNGDLSAFRDRGGNLVVWHGRRDPVSFSLFALLHSQYRDIVVKYRLTGEFKTIPPTARRCVPIQNGWTNLNTEYLDDNSSFDIHQVTRNSKDAIEHKSRMKTATELLPQNDGFCQRWKQMPVRYGILTMIFSLSWRGKSGGLAFRISIDD